MRTPIHLHDIYMRDHRSYCRLPGNISVCPVIRLLGVLVREWRERLKDGDLLYHGICPGKLLHIVVGLKCTNRLQTFYYI